MTRSRNCKWVCPLCLLHWCILLFKASTVITFAGEISVARGSIAPENFIFAKDYHHSRMFSRNFGKVNNSWKIYFTDCSCYTIYQLNKRSFCTTYLSLRGIECWVGGVRMMQYRNRGGLRVDILKISLIKFTVKDLSTTYVFGLVSHS